VDGPDGPCFSGSYKRYFPNLLPERQISVNCPENPNDQLRYNDNMSNAVSAFYPAPCCYSCWIPVRGRLLYPHYNFFGGIHNNIHCIPERGELLPSEVHTERGGRGPTKAQSVRGGLVPGHG
jgi:hypothetical protein